MTTQTLLATKETQHSHALVCVNDTSISYNSEIRNRSLNLLYPLQTCCTCPTWFQLAFRCHSCLCCPFFFQFFHKVISFHYIIMLFFSNCWNILTACFEVSHYIFTQLFLNCFACFLMSPFFCRPKITVKNNIWRAFCTDCSCYVLW